MRFTVSSGDLYNQLQTLSKVLASKNTFEILECFLFEVSDNKIKITASDTENTMFATIPIEDNGGVAGRFVVSSRNILDAMRELPEQPLIFDVDMESHTIKVLYQNGIYNFTATADADEYPQLHDLEGNLSVITIDSAILGKNVSRLLYAIGQDEIRPVMSGIYFDLTQECLAIVASDGHKLVRNRNFTVKSDVPASFILPRKPAGLLRNMLDKENGDVVIKFSRNRAEITYGEGVLRCRLIEGHYPNYNSIIPKNNPNELTIDRKSLLSALRRVTPFSSGTQLVRFHLETGKLELKSEDLDFSISAQEKLACNYSGITMNIGFKGGSFIEILSNLDCDDVIIQLSDPIRAGVVTPSVQPENEDTIVLIMPILLND